MPFHLESLWGATLMPHKGCAMDSDKTKQWGWVKPPVRFWAVCGPKFLKFCGNVEDPSHFPTPLPDCLYHVSFSRYSPLSVEVIEKPNKCNFWPQFFSGGTTPTFLRHIVRAAYCWPFDKVWLSSVWSPSAKPGNEVECGIYIEWVKMQVEFEAVCGPKFMTFGHDVGNTL